MALDKNHNPTDVQNEVHDWWERARAFHAEPTDPGPPFSMVIPPPNVTAALHLGHALNNTIQDVLVRWRRMAGDNAVWLPGTDHAGIATQTVVEKRVLAEEGKKRTDFQRDEFVKKVQAWKDEYEQTITNQLKRMGCSCDWDRQAFTMDEPRARAVREAFFQLFRDGLIYRGKRLVNWDPATQTALADDEVEMEEIDGHFWYMNYPVHAGASASADRDIPEYVTVATTRPETMLGDTAVAVNPNDPDRAHLIGGTVRLPIVNRIIPIVGDEHVTIPDPESTDTRAQYSSGFLKVTPAHDPNDWEIGQRHGLEVINVMAPDGSISKDHGWPEHEWRNSPSRERKLADAPDDQGGSGHDDFLETLLGMDRYEAREAIVEWFRANDLLAEVKPYRHSVGHSYRSHVPVEPYLSDQWYVKVTDDRLAGAALRAMVDDQRSEGEPPRAATDTPRAATVRERPTALAYLISFTCYGNWLHGDERGSVDRKHNLPGESVLLGDPEREHQEKARLKHPPMSLTAAQRQAVQNAIREVCEHRGWSLHALHVRPEHLHVVVTATDAPEKVMNDFKAYATRRLRENNLAEPDRRIWTRHGSTRYLNDENALRQACNYVIERQGDLLDPAPVDHRRRPLPHGRGSSNGATSRDREGAAHRWENTLRFTPARYAKTFQTWHENIRDWCISRQLWWGHRIPVWSRPGSDEATKPQSHEGVAVRSSDEMTFVCLREDDPERIAELESHGFTQDPDVLDTWFSSALWPLSTMGWPEQTPELNTWNPTTVLSTAREIITLWVSRMVMFNLYFHGCVPFGDVFIHAMIQDGEGRKMSKSLGNGVDPLDIIHRHGADAMRFTLTQMTTHTQDVRMPVEVDPQTGRNTSPKFDLGRNFCNKLWNATRFALDHLGQGAKPRSGGGVADASSAAGRLLADRWILSRLSRTIDAVDGALRGYEFNRYVQTLYDFFWRDLCDWYLEAIKPVVRERTEAGQHARATLATCLDASLRLLHPVMPFITEKLWTALNEVAPDRQAVGGIDVDPDGLLIRAGWPGDASDLRDEHAESHFTLLQEVVGAIRTVRNEYTIPPKQTVTVRLRAAGDDAATLDAGRDLLATLAGAEIEAIGEDLTRPDNAAASVVGDMELFILDLIDADAERDRLAKRQAELEKDKQALEGRLANKGYVERAPEHLVQQTRDQLAQVERELETVAANLQRL